MVEQHQRTPWKALQPSGEAKRGGARKSMQSKTALCVPYRPYRISENPTFGGAEKTRPYFIAQLLNVT